MSDVSTTPDLVAEAPRTAGMTFEIDIHESLAASEPIWRSLEERAVLTPYQRFDWIAAMLQAGGEPDSRIAIAVIRRGQRRVALLPLGLVRKGGLTQAHLLGTHLSNSDWLLAEPGFSPSRAQLLELFRQISAAVGGIDLLSLSNMPKSWQGHANPLLVLDHALAPSNFYTATIGPTPVPYIDHRLSAKRRSNINRGRRRLEEQHGAVRLVRVRDDAMLARVHAAFLEQRGARFRDMGIPNMFAEAPFFELFRGLARAGFGEEHPTLCLHALLAGEDIVATSWGLHSGTHYSQYINSTTSGPAARYSLMGILIGELMDALTVNGVTTFDMGLGDFEYKTEWTEAEPVFNSQVALSMKGQIAAAAKARLGAAKRLIKQTPALWKAAQWTRKQIFELRAKG